MYQFKYYKLLKKHAYLNSKVSVVDLIFDIKTQRFTQKELLAIAVQVFRKAPKYSKMFFQSLMNEIFPQNMFEGDQHKQIEQQVANGLVSLYLARGSKRMLEQQLSLRSRIFQAYHICSDRYFKMNASKIFLRANIQFYHGQLSQAFQLAKCSVESLPSTQKYFIWANYVLMAQIHFVKKHFEKCLQVLKICFKMNNDLPIQARLAMAHCYFHLGKFEIAQLCFRRILKLQERCVQALIGIAAICERNEDYELYFYYLKIANKINKGHPLVLLHLAQHFLIICDLQRARKYSQKGLQALKGMVRIYESKQIVRDDYFEFEGRFWNIIGQTYHIKGKYQKALKYYNKILKKGIFCNIWNKLQIAQCMTALQDFKGAHYTMEAFYHQFTQHFIRYYKDTKLISDTYRLMAYLNNKVKEESKQKKGTQYYYLESIKFNKADPYIKFQLSQYYIMQKDYQKAQTQFQNALQLMSNQQVQIAAEILNNYGVIYLQKEEPEAADIVFNLALNSLYGQTDLHIADKTALEQIILLNKGIVAQEYQNFHTAIKIYKRIINKNRLFTDAYLRMGYCWWKLGNKQECFIVLNSALNFENKDEKYYKMMHPDRINILKAYIQLEEGQLKLCEESLKLIEKKDVYTRLLELCLIYRRIISANQIACKIANLSSLAQQIGLLIEEDSQNTFAILGALVINLLLQQLKINNNKQILKQYKVYDALSQLRKSMFKKDHTITVIYNTALYSLKSNQLESAISLLKQIKSNNQAQINSLIAYCQLKGQQTKKAIKTAKLNLLIDPNDLKTRYQLKFLILQRCKEQLPKSQAQRKMLKHIASNAEEVNNCLRFFQFAKGFQYISLMKQSNQGSLLKKNQNFFKKLKQQCAKLVESAIAYYAKFQSYTGQKTIKANKFEKKQRVKQQNLDLKDITSSKLKTNMGQQIQRKTTNLQQLQSVEIVHKESKQVQSVKFNKQILTLKRINIENEENKISKRFKRNALSEQIHNKWDNQPEKLKRISLSEQVCKKFPAFQQNSIVETKVSGNK